MKSTIDMARESHLDVYGLGKDHAKFVDTLKAFEALVRSDEREACAKVCDDWPNGRDDVYSIGVAIRARGNT
jgi:hypothetical protein